MLDKLKSINRDDYNEAAISDIAKEFKQLVDDYEVHVENMSVEELREEEKQIVAIAEAWDKQVQTIKYQLPKSVFFGGKEFPRKSVGKMINELLEKIECEFSYTLGYYELWQWWNNPQATINYNNLNATLQVLGSGLKFKGPHQWATILTINEYFKPVHRDYQQDNLVTILYGTCHSKILDKLNMNDPDAIKQIAEQEESKVVPAELEDVVS